MSCSVLAVDDDDNPYRLAPLIPGKPDQALDKANKTLEQIAGIKTQALQATAKLPEFSAQGTVINLEPLVTLRQQFLAAQALQDSAQARYQEADLNLSRTRNLHQQDIVSTRRLQEQQAQWRNDKANLATSGYQQQSIIVSSRLQWGNTLTEWFTRHNSPQAEQFLNHNAQLLLISLPGTRHLHPGVQTILIDEHGRRDQAIPATLISAAPQVDPITQGARYFFKTEGRKLAFGAHVSTWIADNDKAGHVGVIIPESAVVWHLGQALVFIKTEDGAYKRRLLPELKPDRDGYFAATGFQSGEMIVTTGAQALLSQELKNLIPSEDDD